MNHQIFERKLRSVGVPLEHASFSVVSTYLSDVLMYVSWKVGIIRYVDLLGVASR